MELPRPHPSLFQSVLRARKSVDSCAASRSPHQSMSPRESRSRLQTIVGHSVLAQVLHSSTPESLRTQSKAQRENPYFSSHPPHNARSLPQYPPPCNTSAPHLLGAKVSPRKNEKGAHSGSLHRQANRRKAACDLIRDVIQVRFQLCEVEPWCQPRLLLA